MSSLPPLPQDLIDKAIALTGSNIYARPSLFFELVSQRPDTYDEIEYSDEFCLEKFCFYLFSKEFLDKYKQLEGVKILIKIGWNPAGEFGKAIEKYQAGDSTDLIGLLERI